MTTTAAAPSAVDAERSDLLAELAEAPAARSSTRPAG